MRIIETNLAFSRLIPRRRTTHIIIHHTASSDRPASTFHAEHIRRGWAGIGYHFLIRRNGVIERGRPEATVGSHASRKNKISIGIALTGNFQNVVPSDLQIVALKNLVLHLRDKYDIPHERVMLHRQVGATACPGGNFVQSMAI